MPKSYPVITSRAADKDFENIKAQHADIVSALGNHTERVNAYNRQKSADIAAENTVKMQIEREKAAANSKAQNDALSFAQKNAELDIKRASLSAT